MYVSLDVLKKESFCAVKVISRDRYNTGNNS